jgi:Flp pilus assembly protein TadG
MSPGPVRNKPVNVARLMRRVRADERGAAAIEFAFVAIPFLLFVFGIMVIGLE